MKERSAGTARRMPEDKEEVSPDLAPGDFRASWACDVDLQ
jgi:hypothetical protein